MLRFYAGFEINDITGKLIIQLEVDKHACRVRVELLVRRRLDICSEYFDKMSIYFSPDDFTHHEQILGYSVL